MRAIKFRQWSGDRFFTWGLLDDGFGMHFKSPSSGKGFNSTSSEHEQFTGLLDKNGVEIYEGDIVNVVFDDGDSDAMRVVYRAPTFILEGHGIWALQSANVSLEVIGNVHKNPELLK